MRVNRVRRTGATFVAIANCLRGIVRSRPNLVKLMVPTFHPNSRDCAESFRSNLSRFRPISQCVQECNRLCINGSYTSWQWANCSNGPDLGGFASIRLCGF